MVKACQRQSLFDFRFAIFDLDLVGPTCSNQKSKIINQKSHRFSGDFVDRVTPVPIPNTEVKPVGADGTARETAWESRKSPGLFKARSRVNLERAFSFMS